MGVLTRTLMKAEVARIIDRTDFSETDGAIDLRLSWAYERVAESKYWKVLQVEDSTNTTLVTSTQDYSIPTTLRTVEYVTMVDESGSTNVFHRLNPEVLEDYYEKGRLLQDTDGTPIIWTLLGNSIRLFPVPSSTQSGFKLYIIGKKKISYFTSDSDTTDLDQKLDRAIIYKAAAICFNDLLEEGQEAQRYEKIYQDTVDEAYADELAYSQL